MPIVENKQTDGNDKWADCLHKIATRQDRQAFTALFSYFGPRIKSYCLTLGSAHTSNEMAEELVQEVMLKVWLKATYFNPQKASASTWIFTVARNCRTDFLRKASRTGSPLSADDLWPMAEEAAPYASLTQKRLEKTVHDAIATLPYEQSRVLKHIYMEGRSHAEVAEITGLPLGTVKSRVRLAMAKLKAIV